MQYKCQQLTGIVIITDLCLMDGITKKVMLEYKRAVYGVLRLQPIQLGSVVHSPIQV